MEHRLRDRMLAPLSIATVAIALTLPVTAWTHDADSRPADRPDNRWQPAAMHQADAAGPGFWSLHGGDGRLARRIGLSAEQQASIRALVDRARPTALALRDELRSNRVELMDTPTDGPDYDAVVQRVAESNGRLTSELIRHHAQLRAEVQALMTPEQREQAQAVKLELRSRMERRIEQRLSGSGEILF